MGYPIITGVEHEAVVFQGNLVRSYTVPRDPRSGAQLQARRFFSDVQRMKSQLGIYARGALYNALGSKWSSNLFQIMKADIEGWHSSAVAEWNDFTEPNKEAWRAAAPYRVTFNDMGIVFFALSRVIYHALVHYGNYAWFAEEWAEDESADALAWWQKDLTGVYVKGSYPSYPTQEFVYFGTSIGLKTSRGPSGGSVSVVIDGVQRQVWSLQYPTLDVNGWWHWSTDWRGLHRATLSVALNSNTFYAFRVL